MAKSKTFGRYRRSWALNCIGVGAISIGIGAAMSGGSGTATADADTHVSPDFGQARHSALAGPRFAAHDAIAPRTESRLVKTVGRESSPIDGIRTPPQTASVAVHRFFDTAFDRLDEAPPSPLSDLVRESLVFLRRTLFNAAPTLKPGPASNLTDGQIGGNLNALDEEGDAIAYAVVTAPLHGTVEITPNGSYVYVPGSDFSGSDAFTVSATDVGWHLNLSDPTRELAASATVQIGVTSSELGTGFEDYVPPVGCDCLSTWSYRNLVFTGGQCGNPDNDPIGPWCYTKGTSNGRTWTHCVRKTASGSS
jgi:hypothetical protein